MLVSQRAKERCAMTKVMRESAGYYSVSKGYVQADGVGWGGVR